jgi:hypothetical protein
LKVTKTGKCVDGLEEEEKRKRENGGVAIHSQPRTIAEKWVVHGRGRARNRAAAAAAVAAAVAAADSALHLIKQALDFFALIFSPLLFSSLESADLGRATGLLPNRPAVRDAPPKGKRIKSP